MPVALTQARVAPADSSGELDRDDRAGVDVDGNPKVVSTFRYKVQLWARLQGNADVHGIAVEQSRRPPPHRGSVWVDVQRGEYVSMPRGNSRQRLRDAQYLVLTGPHRFGPIGLAIWLQEHGAEIGFTPAAQLRQRVGDVVGVRLPARPPSR